MSKIVNLDDYRPDVVCKSIRKTSRPNFVTRYRLKKIEVCIKQLEELLVQQAIVEVNNLYPELRENEPAHFNALVSKAVGLLFEKMAEGYAEFMNQEN